jgi:hypothetical protein
VCVSPNFLGAIVQEQLPGTPGIGGKSELPPTTPAKAPSFPVLPRHPMTLGGSKENRNGI